LPESGSNATISRRLTERAKRHDWFAVLIDFIIVVVGIFIGLQVNLWVQTRQDRAVERRYLDRLLADSDESIVVLQQAIALNDRRAATLAAFAAGLENGKPIPGHASLSDVMCRWFVQPAVEIRRGTYAELVSSGRLSLIKDEKLRSDLALQEAAHEEAQRLDILTPAILDATAPLAKYRKWKIVPTGERGTDCEFDLSGMRSDDRIQSVVAQLYRDERTNRAFRQRELAAIEATRSRLRQLL
jgi:hypothetical protein